MSWDHMSGGKIQWGDILSYDTRKKISLVNSLFHFHFTRHWNVNRPTRLHCVSGVLHAITTTKKAEQSRQYAGD